MKTTTKLKLTILFLLIVVGVGMPIVWGVSADRQQRADAIPYTYTYQPVEEINGLADKIGMSREDLFETHPVIGKPLNDCGDMNVSVGCYTITQHQIHIYQQAFSLQHLNIDPVTVLAYEYGHYVWNIKMTAADQVDMKPYLETWYSQHKDAVIAKEGKLLAKEGANYGTPMFYDELHSIVCSRAADNELSPTLLAHCTTFLPNRDVLKKVY